MITKKLKSKVLIKKRFKQVYFKLKSFLEIKSKLTEVKKSMARSNKEMVTCTIGALRASAGLLCGGNLIDMI